MKSSYRYCGKYSKFFLYPTFMKLIINIILESQNDFKLNSLFCVIDENLIYNSIDSVPVEAKVNFELQPECYIVGRKYYLTSFFLRVKKLHKIKLLFENPEKGNFGIYDGPGFMFKILSSFVKNHCT